MCSERIAHKFVQIKKEDGTIQQTGRKGETKRF